MLRSPMTAKRGQRCLAFFALCAGPGSVVQAQLSVPEIKVAPAVAAPAPSSVLAQKVLVQPNRLEMQLPVGYTTGTLYFTLLSEVNTEVLLKPRDPRLRFTGAGNGLVRLSAYQMQTVNFMVLEAHSGVIDILNTKGERIQEVPYLVVPHKLVNQSASLNYSPFSRTLNAGYSVSSVQATPLSPSISAGVGVGYDLQNSNMGGSVYLNVRW